jgi:hypothetical protein
MEITKQNETFNLKDTTELYEMSGSASRDAAGSINIHINVNSVDGNRVGDCNYNKYGENETVNFSVSSSEENREALAVYGDTVVDSVLEYLKASN